MFYGLGKQCFIRRPMAEICVIKCRNTLPFISKAQASHHRVSRLKRAEFLKISMKLTSSPDLFNTLLQPEAAEASVVVILQTLFVSETVKSERRHIFQHTPWFSWGFYLFRFPITSSFCAWVAATSTWSSICFYS